MRVVFLNLLFILIVLVCFFSCQREINWNIQDSNTNGPGINSPVKTSVIGLIVDENDQPLHNVSIKTGSGASTVTDSKGYFRFNNASLDKYASLIIAEFSGYYKAFRVFPASTNGTNFVKIKLIKKTIAGTINSLSGGSVSFNGNTITLPSNSVTVKSTGQPYTGVINVFAHFIDPTSSDISAVLPGSFLGIDSLNKNVVLESYGMLAVELQGTSGELLRISETKSAQIECEIPSSRSANAPAFIPLWYLDETSGIWKQEGRAIKNGNSYKGEVKHFSFWNFDNGNSNLVYVELTIKNNAGFPIPNALVKISRDYTSGFYGEGYDYTDSNGHIGGLVPSNVPLILSILNECYTSSYTHSIGPFSLNTNLGDLRVSLGTSEVQINGVINNCTGQNITNGGVTIYSENKVYNIPANSSGEFNVSISYCSNSNITIVANDFTTSQMSNPYYFVIGVNSLANLQLTACGGTLYTVNTLAGDPGILPGYADGAGSTALFHDPFGVAVDASGNIFVTDVTNHCIRKITPTGVVTTFAGNGTPGYLDGTGTAARFNEPRGIAIDATGNLFVVDRVNCRIRKVTPSGVVTTIAGNGVSMHLDGPSLSASFSIPIMIAINQSGDLYVSELGNQDIRKISTTGIVSTLAGTGTGVGGFADGQGGSAQFNSPAGIVVDQSGDLYISDAGNRRIRKITSSGMVTTLAGDGSIGYADGPGTLSKFKGPNGITIDNSGNLYVVDETNYRIRKINISSGVVSTFSGDGIQNSIDGPISSARFSDPKGIVYSNGSFVVTDGQNTIRTIKP